MDFAFERIAISVVLQYFYVVISVSVLVGIFLFLKSSRPRLHYLLAWFFGAFVFNLFSLSWLYTAYPVVWLPTTWQLPAITALLVVMAFTASLFFPLVGYVHFRFQNNATWLPLILGVSVTVAEYVRSVALSTLFYSPGSVTIGLHWSAGNFGNTLAITPLVEYASIGGIFILSGILALLVSLLFVAKKRIVVIYLVCIVVVWLVIHSAVPVKTMSRDGVVGVVSLTRESVEQENEPNLYIEQKDLILSLLRQASTSPDMLILPEDTRFLQNLTTVNKKELKQRKIATVIDSAATIHRYKLSNYSYAYNVDEDNLQGRGKWFMFPFNEYLPLVFKNIMSLWFSDKEVQTYVNEHTYSAGKIPQAFETPYGNVGTLLCSEMFSHGAISSLQTESVSLVVLQSHLPVFHKSPWLFMSYYLIARVIAAQTRSYLIVSSTDAPNLVVSPYGRIIFRGDVSSSLSLFRVDRGEMLPIK